MNPFYTFENMIVGSCNQAAVSFAKKVASGIIQLKVPLYITGETGIGKTHLLFAIGNEYQKQNREAGVLCMDIRQFIDQIVTNLVNETTAKYTRYLQGLGLLLIDNYNENQMMQKTRECVQELINQIPLRGTSVIIASSQFNRKEQNVQPIGAQPVLHLGTPAVPTVRRFIKAQMQYAGLKYSEQVFSFIHSKGCRSFGEVKGTLLTLLAQEYPEQQ